MRPGKHQLLILTAVFLLSSASIAAGAGNSGTFTNNEDKKEESSFESCGKGSEKGCKKETKKKFQVKKNPELKPENQK